MSVTCSVVLNILSDGFELYSNFRVKSNRGMMINDSSVGFYYHIKKTAVWNLLMLSKIARKFFSSILLITIIINLCMLDNAHLHNIKS